MRQRLLQWLSPPSLSNPGETLRWVRRVSLLSGVFALTIAGQFALEGESGVLIGLLLVGALLSASSWVTLKPAIRRADERGALTAVELAAARGRANRVSRILGVGYCIAFPIAGYALLGVGGAIFFLVLAVLISAFGIWANNRLHRTD